MIVTSRELRVLYKWVLSKDFPDRTYWTPSVKFLREVSDIFWKITTEYELTKWEKFWDCDNFAMMYHTIAHAHFAKDYASNVCAQAPALGQISYKVWSSKHERPGVGHRINTYIDDNKKVRYLEPQAVKAMAMDKEFVSLIDKEIKTIWKVYM